MPHPQYVMFGTKEIWEKKVSLVINLKITMTASSDIQEDGVTRMHSSETNGEIINKGDNWLTEVCVCY